MNDIFAVLEIGTSRTAMAAGESAPGGRMKAVCRAVIPSIGVKKSQILSISQATQSIKSVLRETEKTRTEAGDTLTIGNAFLVVSGRHVKADPYQSAVQVEGAKVSQTDIDAVTRAAHMMTLPRDRELLDIAEQAFSLDSLRGIDAPRGMSGRILKLDTLQIHADANRLNDARTAAGEAHLELRDPLFAATCAAEAVTEESERRDGVMVLDFGGGSTGYAVYCDGCLCAAGAIGVGGDHVTNDIAQAFQTTISQAEALKRDEANAIPGMDKTAGERVHVAGNSPLMESRTLSRRALDTVVNARLKELLSVVSDTVGGSETLHRLHSGVVLAGGGSAMRSLDVLVQRTYGLPVRIGRPLHVDGFENEKNPAAFAALAGALMYAQRNYEKKSVIGNFWKGLFGK